MPLLGRSVTEALGLLVVHDEDAGVAALAPSAETHHREAASGKAPRLDLQDVDGNPVSFDDFSGRKRVLVTWASWCGCRYELAGWQQLQDELADSGLKLFSVALDHDPEETRPWIEAAHPSYPVAIDPAHVTAERYGITNVPSVVWVDEDDNIVKPPTIAPGDDQFVEFTKISSRAAPRRAAPLGPRRRAARERQRSSRTSAPTPSSRRSPSAGSRRTSSGTATPTRPSGTSRPPRSWRRGTGPCAVAASR